MDLRNFLSGSPASSKEHYWALVLESGWVQAGIWEILDNKADVISISPPTPWERDEDLIGACDTALSAAVQNLPEEAPEPSKTVFGVPPSWVEGGQIKEEYLGRIRKICADLSLEPAGFVVLPEAVAHLVKSEEGAPLNAVVIGVGKENLEVAVFKLGNLLGTSVIARSVSIADDVLEGLARFGQTEPIPSRFLLYDGKEGELEDDRQAIMDSSWEGNEKVKFLHTPKIEIVEPNKKVLATALAGASEIANVSSLNIPEEVENVKQPEDEKVSAEDLGFVIDKDIAVQPVSAPQKVSEPLQQPVQAPAVAPPQIKLTRLFNNFKLALGGLLPKKQIGTGFGEKQGRRTLIFGGGLFVAFLIIGFIYWWYYPTADVTVYISPKKIEQKISLSVDTKTSKLDLSKDIIPGEIVKTDVSGDKTKSTSGSKTIGDKAKGTVKIENGTANPLNLTAGTVIIAANDLKFTIDTSASVSAALSPMSPGTATVNVTAYGIGAEYNFGKDESFKVANYPKAEVDAIATATFSGGSSRQIAAVSESDQKDLEKSLTDELLEKAKSYFKENVSSGKYFVGDSLSPEVSSKNFSNQVGDEASNLKLSLNLSVSAVDVVKANLFDLAKEALKAKVPTGYVLRDEQLSLAFSLNSSKGGVYDFDAVVTANLLPETKPDEIAKNITGKYPDVAESYLKTISGFTRAEIKRKPSFPGRLGSLPRVTKHITVEVAAER